MADAARAEAVRERTTAGIERDRAQLSEAAVWLEKDPSHARDLLRATQSRDPQRALLQSEAEDRAAIHVVHADDRVVEMQIDNSAHQAAIITSTGNLSLLDLERGTLRIVDHDLNGPLTRHQGQWCYAKQTSAEASLSPGCHSRAPLGKLLRNTTGHLISSQDKLYVLEAGELSQFAVDSLTIARQHVKGFAASSTFSVLCMDTGELRVIHNGQTHRAATCAHNDSASPVVVNGKHYAALTKQNELITEHGTIALPAAIQSEFALAIGDAGQIAIADYVGEAWIIPAEGTRAERVTSRNAHPTTASISADIAAFGYSDGTVVALDLHDRQIWTFTGHATTVTRVALDSEGHHAISSAGDEIRIWPLRPFALKTAVTLPCRPFHIAPTVTPDWYAMDCSDGHVSLWAAGDKVAHQAHRHRNLSFGITNWRGRVCTGGWDGRVLCTSPDGGQTEELLHVGERIKWLIACEPRGLFTAVEDGSIWRSDGQSHLLYRHSTSPYRLAVDADCTHLASVDYNGGLIVYDLAQSRIAAQAPHAHDGSIVSVQFQGNDVVTAGTDARVKRWRVSHKLELANDMVAPGPIRKFRLFDGGWVASVRDQTFALHSENASKTLQFRLAHPISDIATSPDQRYIAIGILDEVVVLDRQRQALATANHPASDIGCVQFITESTVAVCDTASVLTFDINHLIFTSLF